MFPDNSCVGAVTPSVAVHKDRTLKEEVIRPGVPNPRGLISSEGEVTESAQSL